jgi:SH3 domain protein
MNTPTRASFVSCAILSLSLSISAQASDRYITDVIYIPLRADKDNQAMILKNSLTTGTRLKFIREEEDANKNKWSQVITADGLEGWIRSQNLTTEPTAAMKLEALTSGPSDLVELQKQNIALKNELSSITSTHQSLLKEIEEARKVQNSDINMGQENQHMIQANQNLQTERDILKAENDQLKNTDRYNQQIFGGILVFAGIIISFILQLFGKRKRRSEWN